MVYLAFFCTITLLIYAVLLRFQEKKQPFRRRLAYYFHRDNENSEPVSDKKPSRSRISVLFKPVWSEFKKSFKRKLPGEKEAKIETKLLQAGNPFQMGPVEFRLFQLSLIFLLPVLFGSFAVFTGGKINTVFLLVLFGFGGAFFVPHLILNGSIKKRNRMAVRELPDVLDLLTVSLEAGLGFDAAIGKLIAKKEGILPDEFYRSLEEIRLGKTRREALFGIKERLKADEIRTLINSILQAEKMGIGLVQVLRVQSDEVRSQRRQRAEEEAMKAPIKMLFPLVLFIFPSLFIVLLGPALIQFITTFGES